VIILSHIDPQGLKAAPMCVCVCVCEHSSLPDHFWWCIIIHRTSWSRIQTAQGINGDLIERAWWIYTVWKYLQAMILSDALMEQNKFSDTI